MMFSLDLLRLLCVGIGLALERGRGDAVVVSLLPEVIMRHFTRLALFAIVLAPLWVPAVAPPGAKAASVAMIPHALGDTFTALAEKLPLPEATRARARASEAARFELSGDLGSALSGLCDGTLLARLNGDSLTPPVGDASREDCAIGDVTDVGAFLEALERSL